MLRLVLTPRGSILRVNVDMENPTSTQVAPIAAKFENSRFRQLLFKIGSVLESLGDLLTDAGLLPTLMKLESLGCGT